MRREAEPAAEPALDRSLALVIAKRSAGSEAFPPPRAHHQGDLLNNQVGLATMLYGREKSGGTPHVGAPQSCRGPPMLAMPKELLIEFAFRLAGNKISQLTTKKTNKNNDNIL